MCIRDRVGNIHVFYDGGILATQLAVRFYERVDIIVGIFSIGIVGRHEKYLLFQFFRGSRVTDEREQKEEGNKENAPVSYTHLDVYKRQL